LPSGVVGPRDLQDLPVVRERWTNRRRVYSHGVKRDTDKVKKIGKFGPYPSPASEWFSATETIPPT
jgi:hypothetical protein